MKYIFHNASRLDKKVGLVLFVLFLSVISGGCGRQSMNGDLNHEESGNEAESSNGMTELSAEADDEDALVSKALLNICISEDERVCIPDPSEEKEQYSLILHNAPNEFYDDEDEDDNDFDPNGKDADELGDNDLDSDEKEADGLGDNDLDSDEKEADELGENYIDPDEKEAGRDFKGNLPPSEYAGDSKKADENDSEDDSKETNEFTDNMEIYLVDLSFAGFEEEMFVSSYAIGTMSKKDNSYACVENTETGEELKKCPGNCLVLMVTEYDRQKAEKIGEEDDESSLWWDASSYLLILDYGAHTYYKTKADQFFLYRSDYWNEISLFDLTGDDLDEIYIQQFGTKSICYGVYHLNLDKEQLICIGSSDFLRETDEEFQAKLQDQYQVTLSYGNVYQDTVSIPEKTYLSEAMLEKGTKELADADPDGWIGYKFKVWEHGKLTGKFPIAIYTIDEISCERNQKGKNRLRIKRPILMVHRSIYLGYLYIYISYDAQKEEMTVSGAEFVGDSEEKPCLWQFADYNIFKKKDMQELFETKLTEQDFDAIKTYQDIFLDEKVTPVFLDGSEAEVEETGVDGAETQFDTKEADVDGAETESGTEETGVDEAEMQFDREEDPSNGVGAEVFDLQPDNQGKMSLYDISLMIGNRFENRTFGSEDSNPVIESVQHADLFGTGKQDLILTIRNYARYGELYKLILHRKDEGHCYVIYLPDVEYMQTGDGQVYLNIEKYLSKEKEQWAKAAFTDEESIHLELVERPEKLEKIWELQSKRGD